MRNGQKMSNCDRRFFSDGGMTKTQRKWCYDQGGIRRSSLYASSAELNQPSDLFHLILFEHAGIVIFWFIDPFGDRPCGQFFGGIRP
jgi:hypothetical protein